MTIIETKSRSNSASWMLYVLFGSMGLIGSPIALIHTIYNQPKEALILLPVFLTQIIIGILCLRMILWFSKGLESVVIHENQLLVLKSGTFWIKTKAVFQLSDIKAIVLNNTIFESNSPSKAVSDFSRQIYIFKIQNTGRVKLIYGGGNSYRCLDNISPKQAIAVIEKIKNLTSIN